jgi:hypothetical protein
VSLVGRQRRASASFTLEFTASVILNVLKRPIPHLLNRNWTAVITHPNPYLKLREKLMDDASGKYFAGQVISPTRNPA